jgi:outer membrane protein assembly factor BamB
MYAQDPTTVHPVLVVAFGNHVIGLDPSTGQTLWTQVTSGPYLELLITGDLILVAARKLLLGLNYPTGQLLWTGDLSTEGRATLVAQGGLIFVGVCGEVNCFSRTGQRLWAERFKGKGMFPVALGFPGNVGRADVTG